MSADEKDNLKEIGYALHSRLLVERGLVAEQISELFLPLVKNALSRKFPRLNDPHLIQIAANDAVMAYLRRPENFDPAKSSLIAWLYLDARSNLLNLLEGQKRVERRRSEIEQTLFVNDGANDPERALIEGESPVIKTVRETITDLRDQEMVVLLAEGERETARFAEILEIEHISAIEQAVIVKRHKDRLKAALRRALLRRRYLSILIALAALGSRAKAFARQNPAQSVALAAALLALLGVHIFLWQKTSATRAQTETENVAEMIDSASQGMNDEAAQSSIFGADGFVEKIFFFSNRAAASGAYQLHIWMMNADGTGMEQVTFGDIADSHIAVSPDGTKIAFTRRMSPISEGYPYGSLWVKDLVSGIEIPITVEIDHPWGEYQSVHPVWSPDGKQIAFDRVGAYPSPPDHLLTSIWIMDFLPSIGEPKRITPPQGFGRIEAEWSPDGYLYYMIQTIRDAKYAIYRIDPATGIEEEVIPSVRDDMEPRISPDGRLLAWRAYRHSTMGDIYVADVSNPIASQIRLTPHSGWEIHDWSPDGRILMRETRCKLTDWSMKAMKDFVPADVIARLECARRDEVLREYEFLDIVRGCIGDELTAKHWYRISNYSSARQGLWVVNADGSNLAPINVDAGRKDGFRWARITAEAAKAISERHGSKRKNKAREK